MARNHGFQFPFHPYQVGAWLVFAFFFVTMYSLLAPSLPLQDGSFVAVLVVYTFELLVVIYSAGLATFSDPTDPKSVQSIEMSNAASRPTPGSSPIDANGNKLMWFVCPFCSSHVHSSSKHCKLCDRCVLGFDHHCKYLNNCIGIHNYRIFMVAILSALSLAITQLFVSVVVLIRLSNDASSIYNNLLRFYRSPDVLAIKASAGVSCALSILAGIALGHLVFLHLWLIHNSMTTYEWIVQNRAAEEASKKTALEAQKRREVELEQNLDQNVGRAVTIESSASLPSDQSNPDSVKNNFDAFLEGSSSGTLPDSTTDSSTRVSQSNLGHKSSRNSSELYVKSSNDSASSTKISHPGMLSLDVDSDSNRFSPPPLKPASSSSAIHVDMMLPSPSHEFSPSSSTPENTAVQIQLPGAILV